MADLMPKLIELDADIFNVAFDRRDGGTHLHLGMQVSYFEAQRHVEKFEREYVGKPYPNGRGTFPFTRPRVVVVLDDIATKLLDALKALTEYAEGANDPDWFPEEARLIAVARAAIAKAEGRTPNEAKGTFE